MAHVLANDRLAITIDLPDEGYDRSRFDWTGKIRSVRYDDIPVSGIEIAGSTADAPCGRGFYNEFGIDTPVGFAETAEGDWFHKIGIGLLRKEAGPYDFFRGYEIRPATFHVAVAPDHLRITCQPPDTNGYGYRLDKEVRLYPDGFALYYRLENTGQKPIVTNEYTHNFLAIAREPIGSDYCLQFPFAIDPAGFGETVNPEQAVAFAGPQVDFLRTPREPFFFSNLSGGTAVDAHWALENRKTGIGISETGSFPTDSVNLWGWGHVVSPELFIRLAIEPGRVETWSRRYRVYAV